MSPTKRKASYMKCHRSHVSSEIQLPYSVVQKWAGNTVRANMHPLGWFQSTEG